MSTITACGFGQPAESGCGNLFPLNRQLPETSFAARTVLEALFELGSRHGICIGIQVSGPSILNPPEKIDTRNALLKTVLGKLLETAPDYQFTELPVHGIGECNPSEKPKTGFSKWLTRCIPYFKAERGTLLFVNSFYLRMSYDALDRPAGEGSVGSFSPGDASDLVGPFEDRGKPLESLLTMLIGQSTGAMWIAAATPFGRAPWEIVEYGRESRQGNLQLIRFFAEAPGTFPPK